MTVTNVSLAGVGADGTITTTKRSYVANYKVMTDDQLDGPRVIFDKFKFDVMLPWFGYSYAYGNDIDLPAFMVEINPRRERQNPLQWNVAVTFETSGEDEEKEDEEGKPTSDPLEWAGEVDISPLFFTVPVYKAKYLGATKGDAPHVDPPGVVVGNFYPPWNSNRQLYNPGLESTIAGRSFRVTETMETYPAIEALELLDTVNDRGFTLKIPGGLNHEIITIFNMDTHTALIVDIGGSLNFRNGVFFWRNRLEIHWRPDKWVDEVPDRGTAMRIGAGFAKGIPGTYPPVNQEEGYWTQAEVAAIVRAGLPLVHEIVDAHGRAITEPVLLDGVGMPLPDGEEPVYHRWLKYKVDDLQKLFQPVGPFSH